MLEFRVVRDFQLLKRRDNALCVCVVFEKQRGLICVYAWVASVFLEEVSQKTRRRWWVCEWSAVLKPDQFFFSLKVKPLSPLICYYGTTTCVEEDIPADDAIDSDILDMEPLLQPKLRCVSPVIFTAKIPFWCMSQARWQAKYVTLSKYVITLP